MSSTRSWTAIFAPATRCRGASRTGCPRRRSLWSRTGSVWAPWTTERGAWTRGPQARTRPGTRWTQGLRAWTHAGTRWTRGLRAWTHAGTRWTRALRAWTHAGT